MREPAFTETTQIGIVVRNLEATLQRYIDDFGIGPWEIYEFNPENANDLHEYGQPVERSWRLATTMIGQVQWELIEPLDNESVYARFLAEKGEGVHHIAVAAPKFDEAHRGADRQGKRPRPQRHVQRVPGRIPRHGSRPWSDRRDLQRPTRCRARD